MFTGMETMTRTCDACGQSFGTLTKLRLHEKDSCSERETYAELDADSPGDRVKSGEELLTCRNCGWVNEDADYDQTASYADGDYHMIVEFTCASCGFENENRIVAEGVDRDNLDNLPPHLRPERGER